MSQDVPQSEKGASGRAGWTASGVDLPASRGGVLNYLTVREAKTKERDMQCLYHLVEFFGKDRGVKTIWVPDIREYQMKRLS